MKPEDSASNQGKGLPVTPVAIPLRQPPADTAAQITSATTAPIDVMKPPAAAPVPVVAPPVVADLPAVEPTAVAEPTSAPPMGLLDDDSLETPDSVEAFQVGPANPGSTGDAASSGASGPVAPAAFAPASLESSELESEPSIAAGDGLSDSTPRRERFSAFRYNRLAFLVTGAALLVILLIGAGSIFLAARHNTQHQPDSQQAANYSVGNIPLGSVKTNDQLQLGNVSRLAINGQLKVNDTLVLAPGTAPSTPVTGQIFYDRATNQPYYYNGTQFVSLAPQHVTSLGGADGVIGLGQGLSVAGGQLSISANLLQQIVNVGQRVTSLQGQTGDVTLTAGPGISINGTVLSNSGVVNLSAGSPNLTVTSDGHGHYTVSEANGGSSVASITGTANQINVSSSTGNVVLSLPQDIATTSSPTFGGLTLGGATPNGVLYANGAATVQTTGSSANSVLVTDGSGVPALGQTLPLQVQDNITHTGTLVSGSITAGFGVISTVNNITTTALIQGGSLEVTGGNFTVDASGDVVTKGDLQVQGSNGLMIGVAGTTTGSVVFANTNNSHLVTLQGLAPAGQDETIVIPTSTFANEEVCLLKLGNCVGSGSSVTSVGTQNYISKFTNAAANEIGNSLLYDNGTSVGVGTNTPGASYLLDVNGDLHVAGTTTLDNGLTITAGGATITGDVTQTGNGSFSTGTGAVGLNGPTMVTGSNSFTVNSGATTLGGTLTVSDLGTFNGGITVSSGATITGATNINVTGTANTFIGNASGTFGVASTGLNVSTAGALSGITGYSQSSGNFSQSGSGSFSTGTGAVSLNGATTAASTLAVQGAGGLTVGVVGSTAGVIKLANGTNSNLTTLQSAVVGQNQTVIIPDVGAASDTVCLVNLGNCAGSGDGITGSGTAGALAVFTGSGTIGNSLLTQSGSTVTVGGTLVATALQGDGSGITVLNASNVASGTLNDARLSSNVALLNQSNNFTGSALQHNGNDVCDTTGNCAGAGGGVTISSAGTDHTIAMFTGSQTIANSILSQSGDDSAINVAGGLAATGALQGGSLSVAAGAFQVDSSGNATGGTYNGATISATSFNTANISGGSLTATSVNGLDVSGTAVTGSGALSLTAGGTNQNLTLQGSGTGSVVIQTPLFHNANGATYSFDASDGAAVNATICTTVGNCAGTGGGITGAGIAGTLAVFTGTGTIGNSIITESGTTATVAGTLAATALQGDGSGITGLNASNVASGTLGDARLSNNVALLNGNNNFTGALQHNGNNVCDSSNNCTYAPASGSNNYIRNGVSAQTADFNITGAGTVGTLGVGTNATVGGTLAVTGATTLTGQLTANGGLAAGGASISAVSGNISTTGTVQGTTVNATTTLELNGTDINTAGTLSHVAYLTAASNNFTGATLQHNGNDICDTSGNCAGTGGGVTTTGGTNGTIAMFTGTNSIADSILTQSGTTVTVAGTLAATALQGDGSAVTNVDAATLQGHAASYFTDASNISSGTLGDARLSGNVALLNGSNNFTGATLQHNGNDICDMSGNCAGTGGGITGSGTIGTIPIFTNTGVIGDSILTQSGTTLTVAGTLTATALQGDGSGITNLDGSNITAGTVANAYLVNGGALTVTAGTGLSGGGSVALGSATTISVVYGATSGTAAQGDTILGFTGAGNLTGTVSGTAGGGFTANTLAIVNSPTFSGTLAVRGAGGITVGVAGTTAGTIHLANGTNSNLSAIQATAPSGAGNATYTLPSIVGGTSDEICLVSLGNCAGSGGGVTGSGTTGTISLFSGTHAIGDSILTQSGSTLTDSGNLVIQGANSLALGTGSSNTGSISFYNSTNTNSLTLQAGATGGNLTFTLPTADGSNGNCLVTDGTGTLSFQSCTGGAGGGVTSVNGLAGVLTLDNATGSGSHLTINDASTTQKGIAQFNSTNFSATGGVVNTIQDIATTASPSFANVTASGTVQGNIVNATGAGAKLELGGADINTAGTLSNVAYLNGANNFTGATLQHNGSNVCDASNNCNYAAASGSSNYIWNGTSPQSANFNITGNGTIGSSLTVSGTGSTSLAVAGAPTNSATSSLVQIGNAISGGNSAVNGGTYLGLNAPSTGAGSAADFLNFQVNGTSKLKVANTGAITAAGQLTVSSGGIAVTGNSTITGTLGSLTGLSSSGAVTFSGLGAGVVHAGSGGALSSSVVVLGAETSGNYVASLGTLTGLTAGGTTGAGAVPTLSVNYGALANTAVQGNTTLTCAAGTGNLSGGGGSITLGSGGSCGNISITNSPTFSGTLAVQGAGGITVGVAGTTAGKLTLATAGSGSVTISSASQANAVALSVPADTNTTDEICLKTLGNCVGAGGGITGSGAANTIAMFTGTNTVGNSILTQSGITITVGGNLTATGTINGATISGGTLSGGNISGGTLTATTVDGLNVSGTAISGTGALSIDASGSNQVAIGGISTGDILLGGGSGATGCTVTNSNGNLTCSGSITTTAMSGIQGWFSRSGTTLSPVNTGDSVQVVGSGGDTAALFATPNGAYLSNVSTDANHWALAVQVSGDSQRRFIIEADGTMYWGGGSATQDTNLYRSAADTIATDSNFVAGGTINGATITSTAFNGLTLNGTTVTGSGALAIASGGTNQNVTLDGSGSGQVLIGGTSTGNIVLGGGSGSTGCTLTNSTGDFYCAGTIKSVNNLQSVNGSIQALNGNIDATRASAGNNAFTANVTGDAGVRYQVNADGKIQWGNGAGTLDTTLYRSTAGVLKTDGGLIIGTLGTGGTTALCADASNQISSCSGSSGVTGSGTVNTIAMFTGSSAIGNSILTQTGTSAIGVSGNLTATGTINGATISGGTLSGGSLSATAVNGLSVSAGVINNPAISGTVTGSGTPIITGFGAYNGQTINTASTFTGTVAIQGANALTLGTASSHTGAIVFQGSGGAGTLTLQGPTTPNAGNYTLTIPAITANANLCTDNSVCSGYAAASSTGAYLAKGGHDTSSASYAGNLLDLTNTSTGAAGVLSLTNAGTNSALSITQSSNPASGQALIFANNTAVTPTGNLLDLRTNNTSEFNVDKSGNSTQLGLATTVGLNAQNGLIQGTAGLSVSGGTVNLNPSGTSNTGVTIKPGTDTTAAFQIQNAGGTSMLNFSTASGTLSVMASSLSYMGGADASGTTNGGTSSIAANDVAVSGQYEYAVYAGSSSTCSATPGNAVGCELKVFNISNPNAPAYVGGADSAGQNTGGGAAQGLTSITISGHYAYITGAASNQNCSGSATPSGNGCELKIFDISNPAAPAYVGGADANGTTNTGVASLQFNSVVVSGQYAYVTSDANNAAACSQSTPSIGCELKVFSVSNPATPTYVGGADSTGSTNSGTGNGPDFTSDAISGHYLFVTSSANATACSGTAGSAIGCELKAFDVSTPSAPAYVGGADASGSTNSGTGSNTFNAIAISGSYAYISTAGNATACSATAGSAIGCELQDYNISTPSAPAYVGGADVSGTANSGTASNTANSVAISGNYAYLVTAGNATACSATTGSAIGCELQDYNVVNPSAPVYVGGADSSGSTNGGTGSIQINGVTTAGQGVYVAGNNSGTTCSATAGSALGCEIKGFSNSGVQTTGLWAGNAEITSLQVDGNGQILGDLGIQGNLIVGQSLTVNGAATFSAANSTTAFQIQDGSGTPLFTADTSNSRLYVGNTVADSTGSLLVLDTKNTSGDPTGVNGAMYYNSNSNTFRCYQNGAWADCISGTATTLQSAYDAGNTIDIPSGGNPVQINAAGSGGEALLLTSPSGNSPFIDWDNGTSDFGIRTDNSALHIGAWDSPSRGSFGNNFNLFTDGTIMLQNSTNSPTAFQVQNTNGDSILNVDTTSSGEVTVGGVNGYSAAIDDNGIYFSRDGANYIQAPDSNGYLFFGVGPTNNQNFILSPGGLSTFKPGTDSSSAFQVQNASGASIFSVNTSDSRYAEANIGSGLLYADLNFKGSSIHDWQIGADSSALNGGNGFYIADNTTGKNLFTLDEASGAAVFRNASDTSAAFQIQNALGTKSFLTVDTTGNGALVIPQSTQIKLGTNASISENASTNLVIAETSGGTTIQSQYLKLQDNYNSYATEFAIQNGGQALFQNAVDSATAFQVQNAAGANLINVDSANSNITLLGNNSGGLGPWNTTNTLPSPGRETDNNVFTYNGYIYSVGGWASTTGAAVNSIYYAKLNANGTTSTWSTNTSNPLPTAVDAAGIVAANGYVYVVGGSDGSGTAGGRKSTVYYAKVNGDGSIGAWNTNSYALGCATAGCGSPKAREGVSAVVNAGYIYVMGGLQSDNNTYGDTYYAKLNPDGSTGAWAHSSNSFPTSNVRRYQESVVANGYVYVIGGQNGSAATQSTVYYAKLNASGGDTGTWNSTTGIANTAGTAQPRDSAAVGVADGYLYVIGGEDASATGQSTVLYAPLNNDGTITSGSWKANGYALGCTTAGCGSPVARGFVGGAIANGYVYIPGGDNSSNVSQTTVYYASTSRLKVGGSLDLVGLSGGNLADGYTGGTLTAGNTNIVGTLQVQGAANFSQSVSVGGSLSVGGDVAIKSISNSTNAFQVQNVAGASLLNVNTTNGYVQIQAPNAIPGNTSAGVAKLVVNSNWTDTSGDEAQILFGEDAQDGTRSGKLYFTGVDNAVRLAGLDGSGVTHDVLTFFQDGSNVILQSGSNLNLVSTAANNINLTPGGASNTGVLVKPSTNSTAAFQVQNAGGSSVLNIDTVNKITTVTAGTDSATLGSSLFTGSLSGTGWTASGTGASATATHTTGTTAVGPSPAVGIGSGNKYYVKWTVTNPNAGSTLNITMGGQTLATYSFDSLTAGTYSFTDSNTITSSSTANLQFTPSSSFTGTISAVTVQLVTTNAAALAVNNISGGASLQVRASSNNSNLFVGYQAGTQNVTGGSNTALGSWALQQNVSGDRNMALGTGALENNSTGDDNVALGSNALQNNTTGGINIAIGSSALQSATWGNANIAIGDSALSSTTAGYDNIAIGHAALLNVTSNYGLVAIGSGSGESLTTGGGNTAVGYATLRDDVTGYNNSAFGQYALEHTTANENSAFGTLALQYDSTGAQNTAIGAYSLSSNTTGSRNVALGYSTGGSLTSGTDNTLLGDAAGYSLTTGSNNIIIGSAVDAPSATGNDQLNIGNAIYGDLSVGSIILRNGTDSPTAFQVQYADSSPLFTVNTAAGEIGIGSAGAIAGNELYVQSSSDVVIHGKNTGTADLLQLDNSGGNVLQVTNAGQLKLSTQGPTGGLAIGGDTTLFRYSASMLAMGAGDSFRTFSTGGSQFMTLQSAATSVYLDARNSGAADWVLDSEVVGDTQARYILKTDGTMQWSSGSATQDVQLARNSGAGLTVQTIAAGNSTTAFQVQNSGAVALFNADTVNSTVTVGSLSTTTPTLVVSNNSTFTGTGANSILNVTSSGATTGTIVNIAGSNASQTTSTLLNVIQSGVTTGYTGNVANFQGSSTTGAANVVQITSANTTGGTALNVTSNSATTGSAVAITANALTSGAALKITSTSTSGTGGLVQITDTNLGTTGIALNINAKAGSTAIKLATTGNVIDLASGTTGNDAIFKIASSASCATGTAQGLVFQTTGGTQVGHICTTGTGSQWYGTLFNTSNTDVAENYSDVNNDLAPGDVVALDKTSGVNKGIVKADALNEANVLGVISTDPGLLLSGQSESDGSTDLINPKPVALTGRIPTKVSTENGPIAVGDYLTMSSTPGVAMKATGPGMTIGRALAAYNGSGVGSIEVFAQTQYYNGPSGASYLQNGQDASFNNLSATGTATLGDLNVSGAATINNLTVTGSATIANLTVTGSASFAGNITIGGHVITAGGQPTAQSQGAIGTGASVAVDGTDTTGTITITTGSNPTAGDLAKILFSKTYGQAPHIVLSPSNNNAAGLRFYKGTTNATDFMFDALDTPQANTTYTFDYFIAQ